MARMIIEGDEKKLNVIRQRFRGYGVDFKPVKTMEKDEKKEPEKPAQEATKGDNKKPEESERRQYRRRNNK